MVVIWCFSLGELQEGGEQVIWSVYIEGQLEVGRKLIKKGVNGIRVLQYKFFMFFFYF